MTFEGRAFNEDGTGAFREAIGIFTNTMKLWLCVLSEAYITQVFRDLEWRIDIV